MAVSRVVLMGFTLVLLASALKHTGYVPQYGRVYTKSTARFEEFLSSPASCLLNEHRRLEVAESLFHTDDSSHGDAEGGPPFNLAFVFMSLAFLVIGYMTRVVRLSQWAGDTAEKWLRIAPIDFLCTNYCLEGGNAARRKFWTRLRRGIVLICISIFEAVCELANSMLLDLFWLAAALVWGTFRLLQHRKQSYLVDEDTWGFGQVLALLLSALPLWSLLSNFQENARPPLSIDIRFTPMRNIEGIGPLDSHAWFLGLIGYLLGTALILAGGTIYVFAADHTLAQPFSKDYGGGADGLYNYTGRILVIYLTRLSFSLLLAICLTALALALHFRLVKCDKISTWFRCRMMNWTTCSRRRARVWTWVIFILLLLGIQLCVYLVAFLWTGPAFGEAIDWE
ncbi:MAG: hypothetical protein Q9208_006615 [Pyrenodesmia sp. 3 TL-2023]